MPRLSRIVAPGYPHHIVQRGNRSQDVFFCDEDRLTYIAYLREACQKYGVSIRAYCLMTNHAHFVAVPKKAESLAKCFGNAHVRYTRNINKRENWKGHLWQARFGSSVLDENYLIAAVRYIEMNPVRAGLVAKPWQYQWSSAACHVYKKVSDPLVTGDSNLRGLISDWRKYLGQIDDSESIDILRREVLSGRPSGSVPFIRRLEKRFGCKLTRKKAVRHPMNKDN